MRALIVNPTPFDKITGIRRNPFTYAGEGDTGDIKYIPEKLTLPTIRKKKAKKKTHKKIRRKIKKSTRKEMKKMSRKRKKSHRKSYRRGFLKLPKKFKGRKKHRPVVYEFERFLQRPPKPMRKLKKPIHNPVRIGRLLGNTQELVIDGAYILGGFVGIDLVAPFVQGIVGGFIPANKWTNVLVKGATAVALSMLLSKFVSKDIGIKVGAGATANVVRDVLTNVGVMDMIASIGKSEGQSLMISSPISSKPVSANLSAILNRI